MMVYMLQKLTSYYQLGSQILTTVQYDLLLCNGNAIPNFFTFWQANTYWTTTNKDDDIDVKMTLIMIM